MGRYDEDFLLGDADEVAEIHTPFTRKQNYMLASIPVMIVVGIIQPILYKYAHSTTRMFQYAGVGVFLILVGTLTLGFLLNRFVVPLLIARLNADKTDEIVDFRNKVFGRTGIELSDFDVAYLASEDRSLVRTNVNDRKYRLHSYEDAGTLRMEAAPTHTHGRSRV